MKVEIKGVQTIDNTYTRAGCTWSVTKLIEATKGLEVFKIPLAGLDLNVNVWGNVDSVHEFARHVKRVEETDLQYPIILDDMGFCADGWHRVVKALIEGRETIDAVRLTKMPPVDKCEEIKE